MRGIVKRLPFVLSLVLLVAMPSACARQAASSAPKASPSGAVSMHEFQARLLRYAGTLKTRGDSDKERFASALGVTFAPAKPGSSSERAIRPLADGYAVVATTLPNPPDFPYNEVRVLLPDGRAPLDRDTTVCFWDANDFSRRLEEMGFKRHGQRDFQRGWLRQHWRAIGDGKEGVSASLLLYRTSDGGKSKECVYGIRFGGGEA